MTIAAQLIEKLKNDVCRVETSKGRINNAPGPEPSDSPLKVYINSSLACAGAKPVVQMNAARPASEPISSRRACGTAALGMKFMEIPSSMSLLESYAGEKNLLAYIFEVRVPKASRKLAKRMPVKGLRGSHSTAAHLQAATTAHSYN